MQQEEDGKSTHKSQTDSPHLSNADDDELIDMEMDDYPSDDENS